jgi:hypothetical protein
MQFECFMASHRPKWQLPPADFVDAIASFLRPRIPNIPQYLRPGQFLRFEVVPTGVRSQPCWFRALASLNPPRSFSGTCDRRAPSATVAAKSLLHQRLEYRVGRVFVELYADPGPEIIRQVVQLPAGGHWHQQGLRLFVDGEFGNPDRVRDHLD